MKNPVAQFHVVEMRNHTRGKAEPWPRGCLFELMIGSDYVTLDLGAAAGNMDIDRSLANTPALWPPPSWTQF